LLRRDVNCRSREDLGLEVRRQKTWFSGGARRKNVAITTSLLGSGGGVRKTFATGLFIKNHQRRARIKLTKNSVRFPLPPSKGINLRMIRNARDRCLYRSLQKGKMCKESSNRNKAWTQPTNFAWDHMAILTGGECSFRKNKKGARKGDMRTVKCSFGKKLPQLKKGVECRKVRRWFELHRKLVKKRLIGKAWGKQRATRE